MASSTRSSSRRSIDVTRARQGRLGRNVVWILLVSLLLVVLGFFLAWTWKAGDFTAVQPTTQARQADAQRFDAPAPEAATRQSDTAAPGAPAR